MKKCYLSLVVVVASFCVSSQASDALQGEQEELIERAVVALYAHAAKSPSKGKNPASLMDLGNGKKVTAFDKKTTHHIVQRTLYFAAKIGSQSTLYNLIHYWHANPNEPNDSGKTAIEIARENNHEDAAKDLEKYSARPSKSEPLMMHHEEPQPAERSYSVVLVLDANTLRASV